MILYFGILAIMLIVKLGFDYKNLKLNKLYAFVFMILYGILCAFRASYVGNDTQNYLDIFAEINAGVDTSGWYNRFEYGFVLLNKVCAYFFDHNQSILIISTIIIYSGFSLLIIKYSKDYWMSVFLFVTLGYFGTTMNAIRLCVAYSFVIMAYDRLLVKEYIKFFLLVILAALFHKTAVVFCICIIFPYFEMSEKTVKKWFLVTGIAYLLTPLLVRGLVKVLPAYEYYVDDYMTNGISLGVLLYIFIWTSILGLGLLIQKNNENDVDNNMIYLNYMMMLCVSCFAVAMHFTLLDRIAQYFGIFSLIYVPNCIEIVKNKKMRFILKAGTVIICLLYFVVIQVFRPEWNRIATYGLFWDL